MKASDAVLPRPLPKRCETPALAPIDRGRLLAHARSLLALPTAPYAEDRQLDAIEAFVRARPGLHLARDPHANLLVTWPGAADAQSKSGAQRRGATLAFSAHLDHPGFEYLGARGGVHRALCHGGVPVRCAVGARIAFFDTRDGARLTAARIESCERDARGAWIARIADLEGQRRLARGTPGVFELPGATLRGTRLRAPVCDDLLGAVAILALLDRAHDARAPWPLLGIFTRAEETGFVGCQGLLRSRRLDADTRVVGLECSPQRASARPGAGPVVRVGDAASVFDPEITLLLSSAAARLKERTPDFAYQRALMDGGRCESTAYNLWGVRAGGLCLALVNYHNAGEAGADRGRVAPEVVDWRDFEGLLALMIETAETFSEQEAPAAALRARLDRVWSGESARLQRSARRLERGAGRAKAKGRSR